MDTEINCAQLKRQLSDFLDGELPADQAAKLKVHIDDCQNCQSLLSTLEKTIQLYRRLPRPELPAEASERLWHKLKQSGCIKPNK